MEKIKHRRSRLWLIPIILLALVCTAALALPGRFGLYRVRSTACLMPCIAARNVYLYGPMLIFAPGSQLAGEPSISSVNPISDPDVTTLVSSDGVETLTGGYMPITYFCQGDEQWAELPFGSDTIGPYGCGPTAMAMAVSSMTDQTVNPQEMAQRAVELGCWAKGHGSYHNIAGVIANDFELYCESFDGRDADSLVNALISGKLLVALMGPGHFTNGGHFILLRGVTLSGEILVADPNSRERSLTAWDPEIVLSELSPATDNGSPLWVLSKTEQ